MSLKLKGRYKPEEILRLNPEGKSYVFPKGTYNENIKALVISENCTSFNYYESGLHNVFPNLREVVWPKIEYMKPSQFYLCRNLKYFQTNSCPKLPLAAFKNTGLTSIILPADLKQIDSQCFSGCSKLTEVDMTKVKKNIDIPKYCFFECKKLTEFDFSKCNSIGSYAFCDSGIKNIILTSSNIKIMPFAFLRSKISRIEIDDESKLDLEEACFSNCKELEEVKLPNNTTYIPENAFSGDVALQKISGVENVSVVGRCGFVNCELKDFSCFPSLKEIQYGAFMGNDFEEITTCADKIDDFAFYSCFHLKKVTLNSPEMTSLSIKGAFHMEFIKFFDLSNTSIKEIPSASFEDTQLEEILLPDSLVKIGDFAFSKTKIKKIIIPTSVTEIESGAFLGCKELEEIVWSPNCKKICTSEFRFCSNLVSFACSEHIESIEDFAFDEMNLDLSLPNLESFTEDAFYGYAGIADLRNSAVVVDVSHSFFSNMDHVLLPYFYN